MAELFVHSVQDYPFEDLELDFVITMAQLPIISTIHAPNYIDLQVSPILSLIDEYKEQTQIAPFYLRLSDKDHNSIIFPTGNSSPKSFFYLFLEMFL
jgi:hypothetical protein